MRHNHSKLDVLFNKALRKYRLIEDGDRVVVGLSGGKDSLCLTELLGKRSKIFFPKFQIEALHVQTEGVPYRSDVEWLNDFCEKNGVKLNLVTITIQPDSKGNRSHCFMCSWNRRKAMFEFAQKNGFNTIALGHHQDDIIHTFLMNIMYEGTCGTMPALLSYSKMPLKLIRPLCLVPENLIQQHAEEVKYRPQQKLCPFEQIGKRREAALLFEKMQMLNPEVRQSLWHVLENEGKLVERHHSSEIC